MSVLKIADFYYGAFLSALLNYAGKKPSLFDQSSSRRIYRLTTDNTPKDYMIYTKYVLARKTSQMNLTTGSFSSQKRKSRS